MRCIYSTVDCSMSFRYPQSPLLLYTSYPWPMCHEISSPPPIHAHIQAEAVRQQGSSTTDRQYRCYRNASLSLNVATVVLGTLAAVAIIPIYVCIVYPRMYSWTNCLTIAVKTQQLILLFHCQTLTISTYHSIARMHMYMHQDQYHWWL